MVMRETRNEVKFELSFIFFEQSAQLLEIVMTIGPSLITAFLSIFRRKLFAYINCYASYAFLYI